MLLWLLPFSFTAPHVQSSHQSPLVIEATADWIAACKPAGVRVHDGEPNLLTLLESELGCSDLRPAHRLDVDTSGIVMIARNAAAAAKLQRCLRRDDTLKEYLGVMRGCPSVREGCWTLPLSRKAEGRRNPRGRYADRKPANTRYSVVKTDELRHLALARFTLTTTGRTHQIRRHAALNRHQLAGDRRYGDARHAAHIERTFGLSTCVLHACSLQIVIDDTQHTFEAPPPATWSPLLEALVHA